MHLRTITLLTLLLNWPFIAVKCQDVDMSKLWRQDSIRFNQDLGAVFPEPPLVDESGNKRSLSEFKGKIVYLDFWTTWCGNCIIRFPYSRKLFERVRSVKLDTTIQFVNICSEDSKKKWKKVLKKNNPEGIRLYATDTSFYKIWGIDAFPRYVILDRDGKVVTSHAISPDDGRIDFILYAAASNIPLSRAEQIRKRQEENYRLHRTYTDDDEGKAYSHWFNSMKEELIKGWTWAAEEREKNSKRSKKTF